MTQRDLLINRRRRPRLRVFAALLLSIFAAWLMLGLTPSSASAASPTASAWPLVAPAPSAEARVGASADVVPVLVGADADVCSGQGRGEGLGPARMAVATGVAANTAAKACSFAGATMVVMADGSRKPIDQVKVGDKVKATDPETGETEAREVTHTWVHEDTLLDLQVEGGAVVTTTEDHPFWSVTDQRFERADHLTAGEQILTVGGRNLTVRGLVPGSERRALAYNLTVDGIHTYFVGIGNSSALVHNDCGGLLQQSVNIAEHSNARALAGDGTHYVRGVHPDALANYVDGVLEGNVPNVVTRYGLNNGRVAYWDPDKATVIIEDGRGGTVFTPAEGYSYFTGLR